ncbi:MAG TPA: DivIVA domain-containing protein [Acidimicrobiales bacterium]|jgi:DivIVA domain-containing protein|nr:DivIVA domain-containing protein [Acidimicrobiales bacterium]
MVNVEGSLSADLIAQQHFAPARRGFDPEEVRAFLVKVATEIVTLQERQNALEDARRDAEYRAAHPSFDEDTLLGAVGEETANILKSAHEAAADIKARAEENASRILKDAHQQADMLRNQAETVLARRTEEAETVAGRIRDAGRSEAERLMDQARQQAKAVRAQAEAERNAMIEGAQLTRDKILSALTKKRNVAVAQVEALRAGRERLLQSYELVQQTLEQAMSDLARAEAEAKAAAGAVRHRSLALDEPDGLPDDEPTNPTLPVIARRPRPGTFDPGAPPPPVTSGDSPGATAYGWRQVSVAAPSASPAGDDADAPPPAAPPAAVVRPAGAARPAAAGATELSEARGLAIPSGAGPTSGSAAAVPSPVAPPPVGASAGAAPAGGEPSPGSATTSPADDQSASASASASAADDQSASASAADDQSGFADGTGHTSETVPAADAGAGSAPASGTRSSEVAPTPGSGAARAAAAAVPSPVASEALPSTPSSEAPSAARPTLRSAAAPAAAVDSLFARIRADRERAVSHAREVLGDSSAEDPSPVPDEPVSDSDESLLQRRDEVVEPIETNLTRRLKRALQDDQNDLLDRLRSLRSNQRPAAVLPSRESHAERFRHVARPFLSEAISAGATFTTSLLPSGEARDPAPKADRSVDALTEAIVDPLRKRLEAVLDAGQGDDPVVLAEAVGAAYREWKTKRVEVVAADHVAAAFSAGAYAAIPLGMRLRWLVDDIDGPCPDCDDNALAGPLRKGEEFPTGQRRPPAHPGCRCLLVPAAGGATLR